MSNIDALSTNSPTIQTTMDAGTLQQFVNFCYTNEVSVTEKSQALTLLDAAKEYQITDALANCQECLNSTQSVEPPIMPEKLIIFGSFGSEHCFSGAMLESMNANWLELEDIVGSNKYKRQLTSVAYCGDDVVVITGGLEEEVSKRVSHVC